MGRHASIAIRMAIVTIVIFGIVYPLVITGLAQAFFPTQANGSLIKEHSRIVGSKLIGQKFVGAGYFYPRPSAAGSGYDAAASGGSNLGPTSRKLADTVQNRIDIAMDQDQGFVKGRIPVDMVTASASGLDPDISPANAYAQVSRVAHSRGLSEDVVRELVQKNTIKRTFGFLGEQRINVIQINRALSKTRP